MRSSTYATKFSSCSRSNKPQALVEIGFKTIGGATNVGITLQPPLGLHGAELDLFVPWPMAMDGWWPHEYTP